MAFTPILSDLSIDNIRNNTHYRNANREVYAGDPVFYTPSNRALGANGFGGPKYVEIRPGYPPYYNYDNSPSAWLGNCTWWCAGRLEDALGKRIFDYFNSTEDIDANKWYDIFTGTKYTNANNAVAGDIVVMSDSGPGHVFFIEKIEAGVMYISQSAYSQRIVYTDKACITTSFNISDIYAGNQINIYQGTGSSAYYETIIGVIHTGDDPAPSTPKIPIFTRLLNLRRKRGTINVKLFKQRTYKL